MEKKNTMGWGERSILQASEGPGFSVSNCREAQAGKLKQKKREGEGILS